MSTIRRITTNSAYTFFGNNITKILTMILTIFIARYFSEVDFGKLSFALSFTGLFIILVDLGTRLVIVREIAQDKLSAPRYFTNVLFLKILSGTLSFGVIALLINVLRYPVDTKVAVYIGAAIMVLESISNSMIAVFNAFEKMRYPAFAKILRVSLRFAITIPLLLMGFGLIPVMLAYLGVHVINILYLIITLRKKIIKSFDSIDLSLIKELIKKGFPFLLSSAFVIIYFRIDITMLSIMKGDAVVGWYNSAYTIIDALISIPIALTTAILPVAVMWYGSKEDKLMKLYKTSAKIFFSLSIPLAFGGTLLASKIMLFVFGNKYAPSIPVFKVLIWVLVPLFSVHLLGTMMTAIRKEKLGVPVLFATALINILLNLFLIPKYSMMGAAIATIVSELVYFSAYYRIISKEFKFMNMFVLMIKPVIASLVMSAVLLMFINTNVVVLVILGMMTYAAIFYIIKGISNEEKEMLISIRKS